MSVHVEPTEADEKLDCFELGMDACAMYPGCDCGRSYPAIAAAPAPAPAPQPVQVAAPGDVEQRIKEVADFAHACGTLNHAAGENENFNVIEAELRSALRSQGQADAVPEPKVVPYGSASGTKDYAYGYEKGVADGWNACLRELAAIAQQANKEQP